MRSMVTVKETRIGRGPDRGHREIGNSALKAAVGLSDNEKAADHLE